LIRFLDSLSFARVDGGGLGIARVAGVPDRLRASRRSLEPGRDEHDEALRDALALLELAVAIGEATDAVRIQDRVDEGSDHEVEAPGELGGGESRQRASERGDEALEGLLEELREQSADLLV